MDFREITRDWIECDEHIDDDTLPRLSSDLVLLCIKIYIIYTTGSTL